MRLLMLAELCLACAPFMGFVGYSFARETDSTPWIAGIASVLVTALMVPVVKWMMNRIDGDKRQSEDLAARREKREDDRQTAFEKQVGALTKIVHELELLNDNHKALDEHRQEAVKQILDRIDGLPAKIVKKCNES